MVHRTSTAIHTFDHTLDRQSIHIHMDLMPTAIIKGTHFNL
jgi:hypothetical protein